MVRQAGILAEGETFYQVYVKVSSIKGEIPLTTQNGAVDYLSDEERYSVYRFKPNSGKNSGHFTTERGAGPLRIIVRS